MPSEPEWLLAADIVALHAAIVTATGEPSALGNLGLLESAVARPRQHWSYAGDGDVVDLSCFLMLAIARNHPLVPGNKRAGFVAGQAFLIFNGYELVMPESADFADHMIRTVADQSIDPLFVSRVRRHVAAVP